MTTNKTIKSKNQPKQTNVTWVDLSGKTPVEKHFINGRWIPIGGSGGGSTNPGYDVTKQTVTLFDDTIETSQIAEGLYQGVVENIDFDLVAGETYTVVFDGVSYDIEEVLFPFPVEEGQVQVFIGELDGGTPSFETYPFLIMYEKNEEEQTLLLLSETEGSHTVVIKHEEETVTTTPEFKSAVDSVTGYSIDKEYETLYDGTIETADSEGYISGIITPTITFVEGDTYKVTFNGTEYICKCLNYEDSLYVGAPCNIGEGTYDWSTYPFNIETYNAGGGQNETVSLYTITISSTNQEGSYTLKIEHLTTSTETTPEFVSMIQGIAGSGSASGCKVIYPDSISYVDDLYSLYNKVPEAGNIYFIPLEDKSSTTDGEYLYPVYIEELEKDLDDVYSGIAIIIGTPIINDNNTLTILPFNSNINPEDSGVDGLCIDKITRDDTEYYRLFYGKIVSPPM